MRKVLLTILFISHLQANAQEPLSHIWIDVKISKCSRIASGKKDTKNEIFPASFSGVVEQLLLANRHRHGQFVERGKEPPGFPKFGAPVNLVTQKTSFEFCDEAPGRIFRFEILGECENPSEEMACLRNGHAARAVEDYRVDP